MITHTLIWFLIVPALIVGVFLWALHRFLPVSSSSAAASEAPFKRWLMAFRDAAMRLIVRLGADVGRAFARLRDRQAGDDMPVPVAGRQQPPAPARRTLPPIRAAGGSAPGPGGPIGLSLPWQNLCSYVADFQPETDAEYLAFLRDQSGGFLALAEAYRANAENLLNEVGLDPAAVHSQIELSDVVADNSSDVDAVRKQFLVVYEQLMIMAQNNIRLPHNARVWITGEVA